MNKTVEETIVQDSQPRPRKLTLARETLRTLGDATLAHAAGGQDGTMFWETDYGCDTSGSFDPQ